MSKDECLELKNIKYQNMLMNKKSAGLKANPNIIDIDKFLKKRAHTTIKKTLE